MGDIRFIARSNCQALCRSSDPEPVSDHRVEMLRRSQAQKVASHRRLPRAASPTKVRTRVGAISCVLEHSDQRPLKPEVLVQSM